MSDALSIAVNGINASVARTTQSARDIVNASSTGADVTKNVVNLDSEKVNVVADAAVIRTVHKMDQSLLDIIA